MTRIAIVTPVLDDWEAFSRLLHEIDISLGEATIAARLVIVDDGSKDTFDAASFQPSPNGGVEAIEVVTLGTNLGHQRAIATGLVLVAEAGDVDAVVVMDSDGEDRAADVVSLAQAFQADPASIVLARRTKRHESARFKAGYFFYKLIFRLLIGRSISFGNFSLIPRQALQRLVYMPELWNNLAAAILRSRLPIATIPTERGRRYAGRSRMNVVSLIVHGLSAISVYIDTIFVRVLVGGAVFGLIMIVAAAILIVVRVTVDWAIPGWTTTAVGILMILLVQMIVLMVAGTLVVLAGRSVRPTIPRADAVRFVKHVRTAWPAATVNENRSDAAA